MITPSSQDMSRALFTLSGGLERATGQPHLEAVGRAKQASVLFDEIIVESGLHVVELQASHVPAMIHQHQAQGITPELLRGSRTVVTGTKTGIAIRILDDRVRIYFGTDLPRFDDATYYENEVAYRYVSEYHTGILDELAALRADWVRVVAIGDDAQSELCVTEEQLVVLDPHPNDEDDEAGFLELNAEQAHELGERLAVAAQSSETGSAPARPSFRSLDAMLADELARGVRVGQQLGATPAFSAAYAVIAESRGVPVGLPGAESVGFLIPDFTRLPWEAVASFRDHPGAVEARGRLREFENEVRNREAYGSAAYIRSTGRAVSTGLLAAAQDLAPSLPERIQGSIASSAIGFVPVVGQLASLAISMGDVISALRGQQEFDGSWLAAILDLRDAAADAMLDW